MLIVSDAVEITKRLFMRFTDLILHNVTNLKLNENFTTSDNDYFTLVSDINLIAILRCKTNFLVAFKNIHNTKVSIRNNVNKP